MSDAAPLVDPSRAFRLDGRVAVVTGGGGGIGGATCTLFANVGAKVACLDVDVERAGDRVAAIVAAGGTGLALACAAASFVTGTDLLVDGRFCAT